MSAFDSPAVLAQSTDTLPASLLRESGWQWLPPRVAIILKAVA